jgi:hypothetical protein
MYPNQHIKYGCGIHLDRASVSHLAHFSLWQLQRSYLAACSQVTMLLHMYHAQLHHGEVMSHQWSMVLESTAIDQASLETSVQFHPSIAPEACNTQKSIV